MPECSRTAFVNGSYCFKNFNRSERASILIYYNAAELVQIGGTNYTNQLGSGQTLSLDSVCLMTLPDNPYCPPTIYDLYIAYNNAVASGASVVSSPSDLATAIACNKNFPLADKNAMILWLTCSLGEHA